MKKPNAAQILLLLAILLALFALWFLQPAPGEEACGRQGGRLIDGNCYVGD